MKTKFYFSIILLSLFFSFYEKTNAQAPDWLWAKSMGGIDFDKGYSIATDASGNVYTTGSFSGTVDFDPGVGTFNLTSAGGYDIFISKLDGSGNFVWAKHMIGAGSSSAALSIDLAPAGGDVYTTGHFSGPVDFDPGAGTFNLTDQGIFISRLDSSGNFIWAKVMVGTGSAAGSSIAVDPAGSGNVYTTGYFGGDFGATTIDFDPGAGTFNLTSPPFLYYLFVSKLDSSGNFVWAKSIGGTAGSAQGYSIALDPTVSGDVYTTGNFGGTVDFDPDSSGNFNLTSAGSSGDIFISKLDNSGNFVWAKAIGGTGGQISFSIALDPASGGNVYTTGYFQDTVDFDPGIGTFNLTAAGFQNIFISKLDNSGNFVWAKQIGGAGHGLSIALDPAGSGDIYTTGSFQGTADFDPGAETFNLTSVGYGNIFISKLDGSGNFAWAKAISGSHDDFGYSIALDDSGNVFIVGYFRSSSVTFGSTTLTNAGGTSNPSDIFIAKLDNVITGIESLENSNSISVYPNPATNHLTIAFPSSNKKAVVTITDITGKIIYSIPIAIGTTSGTERIEVNTKNFIEGVYVVRIQTPDFIESKKLIIAK